MIQKAMIIGKIDADRHSAFTEMRKDTFSSLPNQVYFMQKAIETPVKTALYRVLIDPRAL
jgi:hypothetical protein